MSPVLAEAIEAYQALLEGHRMCPDNEDLWDDVCKAKAAMETAWLQHTAQIPLPAATIAKRRLLNLIDPLHHPEP